jgi:hypothetical protein
MTEEGGREPKKYAHEMTQFFSVRVPNQWGCVFDYWAKDLVVGPMASRNASPPGRPGPNLL